VVNRTEIDALLGSTTSKEESQSQSAAKKISVVQSQISLTDDEKVKRQLAKLSTSMQDLACDRTIINNIVNHVDSIGNIINDVDIKLKDGLVKNFGEHLALN
jgi:hypothetical protein